MGCLLRIKELLDNLNPSERKIANYILDFTDECLGKSISELAEESNTSKAAVVRFCKTLGYDGYRDFMVNFSGDVARSKTNRANDYADVKPGDELEAIIKNVCGNSKKAIDDTLSVLSFDEVKKAVEVISKAKRVDFYGVGASGIIAMDAQQKFLRINKVSFAYTDSHLQATAAATLEEGDVAVVMSYSGETKEIHSVAKIAKQYGATVISITKYGKNSISDISDIKLFVSSPETSIRSAAMGSRIAQLNLIDMIYLGIVSRDFDKSKEYLERTRKVLKNKKFY
jgi:DNA-binding MurR/RpiR family transcriptional regulator